MGADELDQGKLRSIWTHKAKILSLQDRSGHKAALGEAVASNTHAGHVRHHSEHGSPSKAFMTSPQHQALLPDVLKPSRWGCFSTLDREVLCNALACAGASMADPLMSMVDTYYAGKLGTTALAALGSNGALFSVMYFLCFTALAVLCTQAMASANSRGDAKGVGRGFIQALVASAVVSSILVCILLLAPEHVLGFFQTNAETMPYAKTYCMIRALSLPAALGMNVCQAAFRSLLDLGTPFAVVMTANAANYVLDQLLMFRLGWGMAGCGWASVLSQYIGAALFAAIIYKRRHKFGIPEALACASDRYHDAQHVNEAAPAVRIKRKQSDACGGGGKQAAGGSRQQQWQPPWHSWQQLLPAWVVGQQQQQQQQRHKTKSQPPAGPGDRSTSGSYKIHVIGSPAHRLGPPAASRSAGTSCAHSGVHTASDALQIKVAGSDRNHRSEGDDSVENNAAHVIWGESSVRARMATLVHRTSPTTGHQQHQQQFVVPNRHDKASCMLPTDLSSSSVSEGMSNLHHAGMSHDPVADATQQELDAQQQQAGWDSRSSMQPPLQQQVSSKPDALRVPRRPGFSELWDGLFSPRKSRDTAGHQQQPQAAATSAAGRKAPVKAVQKQRTATFVLEDHSNPTKPQQQPQQHRRIVVTGAYGVEGESSTVSSKDSTAAADAAESGSSGDLRRLDSLGSDSKFPRVPAASTALQRVLLLLHTLEWAGFVRRFLGMTVRGMLILSTYSSASMVAAKAGTAMLAAHQVVQQQQQLQMSFAWSFLHVGQSMTANVFHASSAAGGGPKAARRLAVRIICWATFSCVMLALLTYNNRWLLSGVFTRDANVRRLVSGAALPATIMLSLAWNNALEGCLLAADEQPYVVKVYPYAVAAALTQLARAGVHGLGLPGVWWGLVLYYLVLLVGFAGRFWWRRGKI